MNWFLFLFTLYCVPLFSLTEKQEAQSVQAVALFSVGKYEEAERIYLALLASPLEPWEKNLLKYNLGTIYVAQGEWEKALDQFAKVSFSLDFLLNPRNEQLALIGEAKSLQKVDFRMAQLLLREAHPSENRQIEQPSEIQAGIPKEAIPPVEVLKKSISSVQDILEAVLDGKETEAELKKALETASEFPKVAVQWQENKKERTCQIVPWDKILPLFDEGYQQLSSVSKEKNQRQIFYRLNKTVFLWLKAIQQLEEPSSMESQVENREKQQLVQDLIEMDRNDRKEAKPVEASPKGNEKPW